MNPMMNLNLVVEKELELEQQGLRRTRRFIGDANQVVDARWYQTKASQFSGPGQRMDTISPVAENKSFQESLRSILTRFYSPSLNRRQTAKGEA
jgi:hypothetical protein